MLFMGPVSSVFDIVVFLTLWFVFILLCLLNIDADNIEIDSIHSNVIDNKSNEIFLFTLIVTFFIYLYFLIRNINSYDEINNKKL